MKKNLQPEEKNTQINKLIERTKNFLTSTVQAQWSSDDPFGREIYNETRDLYTICI